MDNSLKIYLITFGVSGVLMAYIRLHPPQTSFGKLVFWLFFILVIFGGYVVTYWDSVEKEKERGRTQTNLGINILRADKMEEKADRMEKLLEKAERENKEQREYQTNRQARDKRRQETFFIPLSNFIHRGDKEMRSILGNLEFPLADAKRVFEPLALKWANEVSEFLKRHCSDQEVAKGFNRPIEEVTDIYLPFSPEMAKYVRNKYRDGRDTHLAIVGYYDRRVEYLRKLQTHPLGCT